MSDTNRRVETLSNRYPEADRVGDHLVIDKSEWVPGMNPERRLGEPERYGYFESYFRCLLCGVEVLSKSRFPEECDQR
jgi:hypothetical protein